MSEQTPAPVVDPTKQDPVEGSGAQTPTPVEGAGKPFKVLATEQDAEAWKSVVLQKPNKEIERLRTENERLKQKNESETEKAERERTEATQAAVTAAEQRGVKMGDLRAELRLRGMTPEQAQNWAQKLAGDEWDTPDEAVKLLETGYGLPLPKTQTKYGGGGGPSDGPDAPDYSPEAVQARIKGPGGKAWYVANRAKIKQWRQEHGIGPQN